jgi:hypothetical protein
MRRKHTTEALGIVLVVLAGAGGCTAYPTEKNLPLDCSVEDAYDFQSIDNFETVGTANLWTAGDTTNADVSVSVQALTDGPRCGSTAALEILSAHNNDWGSLFGFNNFGPRDESAWEGLSFWARAPGNTTKGFTVLLDDPNTATSTSVTSNCTQYATADGGSSSPTMTIYDPSTGMAISGATTSAPPPNACGNSYQTVVTVTTSWQLYTIPWGKFQQTAMPNRVPNADLTDKGPVAGTGLLISQLLNLTLRMPKEADMELWIDNLSFYRKKGAAGANGDGGTDAPHM